MADIGQRMLAQPQLDIPVRHEFSGGMYARTMIAPKDALILGGIHLTDHVNVVNGDISIMSDGVEKRYTGYHVIPSIAGVQRIGFVHSETMWTTILRTELTSVEEIERKLVAKSHDDPRVIALNKTVEIGE
jgi:hypothetical protein